jgi:hypothetical protein
MDEIYVPEVFQIRPVSDLERRPKMWIIKRQKAKKKKKNSLENVINKKEKQKSKIDIYV